MLQIRTVSLNIPIGIQPKNLIKRYGVFSFLFIHSRASQHLIMDVKEKPILFMCITPLSGHFNPLYELAKRLISVGFDLTVLTGSRYRHRIESAGGSFVALEGEADICDEDLTTKWPEILAAPKGPQQLAQLMKHAVMNIIPAQFATVQSTLRELREKHPHKPIVVVSESAFLGAMPIILDGPCVKPTAFIRISIYPMSLSSIDTAPFGLGLPPDSSPEGRERNKALALKLRTGPFVEVTAAYQEKLREVGAKPSPYNFIDAGWQLADLSFQACCPSVEYPRSDMPSTVRFLGGVPRGNSDPWTERPPWWDEIVAAKMDKKIVIGVCQGTAATNLKDVVAPTLDALKDRDELIVVVVIGRRGGTLPANIPLRANARVWDYVPYDDLLPHVDVFVTTGGYGAFQHSIGNGVPLVIAGDTEEKVEVAARAAWAGAGVNLKTGNPTPQQIKDGVDTILSSPKYKQRALELKAEVASFDPVGILVDGIWEVLDKKAA